MLNVFKKLKKNKKGFTLVELIIVIAIIGILAAVLIPRFSGFTDGARDSQVTQEAKSIATAMEAIYAETGSWPANQAAIETKIGKTLEGTVTIGANGTFTYAKGFGSRTFTANYDANGKITVSRS